MRGHAELARQLRTPVCLDESITSARAAADAIALGACSIVNIKPGGSAATSEARAIHDVCVANGVAVWAGGMLETGLGRAANVASPRCRASPCPATRRPPTGTSPGTSPAPFVLESGHLRVPTGPGLGIAPDPDVLRRGHRRVPNGSPESGPAARVLRVASGGHPDRQTLAGTIGLPEKPTNRTKHANRSRSARTGRWLVASDARGRVSPCRGTTMSKQEGARCRETVHSPAAKPGPR